MEQGIRLLLEPAMKKSTTQNKSVFLARLGFTREEVCPAQYLDNSTDLVFLLLADKAFLYEFAILLFFFQVL